MTKVTIHVAKTTLSKLIDRVEHGEEIVIARGATPVARLVGVKPKGRRTPGGLKAVVSVSDEFFEPLPDIELAAWEEP